MEPRVLDGPSRLGDGVGWCRNAERVAHLCEDVCSYSLSVIDNGGADIPDLRRRWIDHTSNPGVPISIRVRLYERESKRRCVSNFQLFGFRDRCRAA